MTPASGLVRVRLTWEAKPVRPMALERCPDAKLSRNAKAPVFDMPKALADEIIQLLEAGWRGQKMLADFRGEK